MAAFAAASAFAQQVTINVDAHANRHAIDPRIYGVAHASSSTLADLNVPINRHGGNPTSRYNWQVNADNRGFDWFFQSLAYGSAEPGEGWDGFVQMSRDGGAQPMLTVPIIGWVAKLGPNRGRLSSFSIAKYGAQQSADYQWFPDAGNGVRTNGQNVTGNDPNDASVLVDSTFQQQGVQHLVNRWGPSSGTGVRYYILDNEHSIWHSTHRDVRPTGATMDEIRQKMIDHATKIKAVDPAAQVLGPEEWGWSGYLYSGYDLQWGSQNGWSNLPDRAAHGGSDYMPWLLRQMRDQHNATGTRLLDIFTLHIYPQGGEFSNDTSAAMQARRNRSTRALWDPNYTDETWINDKVRLIPRMKEWVAANYPGTPIGITEWNWGAEGHINGATALADVLGIFGREGLDMGAYWTVPGSGTPAYKAIRMYRNYDGNRSTFGDTSVAASGPNPDNVAVFAAQRSSDRALTVMVINKGTASATTRVNLLGFRAAGAAQAWQLTASNAITRLADVPVANAALDVVLPAQAITLFVVPAGPVAVASDLDASSASDLVFQNSDGRVAAWLMNGTAMTASANLIGAGSGWSVTHVADLDGDAKADILFRHNDGRVYAYRMNGLAVAGGKELLGAGLGWSVSHVADFDGDGKADLLLRHADGRAHIWLMDGMAIVGGAQLLPAASGWNVVATGDINGDGKADIVFMHDDGRGYLYLMNGATVSAGAGFLSVASGWTVSHVADVDGDGKADLLFRHADGRAHLFLMNGTTFGAGASVLGPGTGWSVTHAGDLNGDGKDDLVFRHTDGRTHVRLMNGTAILSGGDVLAAGSGWRVTQLYDVNGDAKRDLVLRHDDGSIAVRIMNGLATTASATLVGPGNWAVVPAVP
jgi:hypothetical protein